MTPTFVFLFTVLLINNLSPAHALTGNEWQSMNGSWHAGYVAGVLDGWSEAASKELMDGKSNSVWMKVLSCITTMKITYRQVAATVEKYVKEHPEEWHNEASTLVYRSLTEICRTTE